MSRTKFRTFEGRVESLSHDGDGVIKIEGKVYFVRGVLPGELVSFSAGKKRRGKFEGRLLEILETADDRVVPPCEYFGVCGGCVLQHLMPGSQLLYKQQTLLDNLQRIGKITPTEVLPALSESNTGYRRKARLGLRDVAKKGGVLIGFRERKSSYITSLQQCLTLDARLSGLLPSLHRLVESLSIRRFIPQIECAAADNTVALIIRHLEVLTADDLSLISDYAQSWNIQIFLQSAGPESITPHYPPEPEALFYKMPEFNLKLEFGVTDFIQVNADVNQAMIAAAIRMLDIQPDDQVLDLFCGLGNFTLALARQGVAVQGVEGDLRLVELARRNAINNELENTVFSVANLHVEDEVEQLRSLQANKVLLDPPRSGALEVVTNLIPVLKPQRIVYISCNPATLARDSEHLVHQLGYRLTCAGAIDMFPHTAHVESIAVFEM